MSKTPKEEIKNNIKNKEYHIIPYMHADWAWCNKRKWHELRYVAVFEDVLALMEKNPDYKWYLDCYLTELVPFLKHRPQKLNALKKYVAEGRIGVCGVYVNVRPNMVGNETYIRNITIGKKLFGELFDTELNVMAEAVDVAIGHPQLPQILSKAGYKFYRAGRPYDMLAKLGYPNEFIWQGIDDSKIIVSFGEYSCLFKHELTKLDFRNDWDNAICAIYQENLMNSVTNNPTKAVWISRGCDDILPMKAHNSMDEIDIEGIMNGLRSENSIVQFSTPNDYCKAIEKHKDELKVYAGSIDICDVPFNSAWNGEKGLWNFRYSADKAITNAEKLMTINSLLFGEKYHDTHKLWKEMLNGCAHATQWLFTDDFELIYNKMIRVIENAKVLSAEAAENISKNIALLKDTLCTAHNPSDVDISTLVKLTLPCKSISDIELVDGDNNILNYQIVEPFEYTDTIWEYDIITKINIPRFGYNTISVSKGDISCREGEIYTPPAPKHKKYFYCDTGSLFIENKLIKFEIKNGNIINVYDKENKTAFLPKDNVWNRLTYNQVDHRSGGLHVGPITGKIDADWEKYIITENGPVRWSIELYGYAGRHKVKQTLSLLANEKNIHIETCFDWELCGGFLTLSIPLQDNDKLIGGIPFGCEEKDITKEQYLDNFHRLREGLFFAKDFVSAQNSTKTVTIIPVNGDRYFISDKNSLQHILINSIPVSREASCEKYMNYSLEGVGKHKMNHVISFDSKALENYEMINKGIEYKTTPIIVQPDYSLYSKRDKLPTTKSFIDCSDGVKISAFYMEDSDIIIRIYDILGKDRNISISMPIDIASIQTENLIKEKLHNSTLVVKNNSFTIDIDKYQIMTFRITAK